jgi:hypothetical protein
MHYRLSMTADCACLLLEIGGLGHAFQVLFGCDLAALALSFGSLMQYRLVF